MKTISAATFALLTMGGIAQAGWTSVESSVDAMTDAKNDMTFITTSTSLQQVLDPRVQSVVVRCNNNNFEIIMPTDAFISTGESKVQYRAGEAKPRTITTSMSTTGTAHFLTGKNAARFLKDISESDTLKIVSYDYNGTTALSEFADNKSGFENVRQVAASCKFKF